jgi:hypothetical protein
MAKILWVLMAEDGFTGKMTNDALHASSGIAAASDGELLAAFAGRGEQEAFAELVRRHGGMVLGVCRSVVGESAAAEDAAQAVFLTLVRAGMHPFGDVVMKSGSPHSPWADEGWDVYLDSEADIRRAVAYVEGNPEKEGKPRQRWSFVTAYTGSGW